MASGLESLIGASLTDSLPGQAVLSLALNSRLSGREFDSRSPRFVLGSVTVFGRANHLRPPKPTQPPTLSGTGNEY